MLFDFIESSSDSQWLLLLLELLVVMMRLAAYAGMSQFESQHQEHRQSGDSSVDSTSTSTSTSPIDTCLHELTSRVSSLLKNARLRLLSCHILTQLFKLYFHTHHEKLCTPLLRIMDSAQTPQLHTFPSAHQAAFLYYKARLLLNDEAYTQSRQCLEQAFAFCPDDALHNKQQILMFLIPLVLYEHRVPRPPLVEKYKLTRQFGDVCASIKSGDIGRFQRAMHANRALFMSQGIFLLIAKIEQIVMLRLVQRCAHTLFALHATQLPIDDLLKAVHATGAHNCDSDQLECMLANLIHQGLIKGYIAHKRCIVLSKHDPFPKPAHTSIPHSNAVADDSETSNAYRDAMRCSEACDAWNM